MNKFIALQIISDLWGIIDDIDSQDDACKDNDSAYRKRVSKLQSLRWDTGIKSDGHSLTLDGDILPSRTDFRL